MRTLAVVFSLASGVLASQSEAYTYHWEIDETIDGTESASLIEPVQVELLDEVVDVASHSASLQLRMEYSVHLDTAWTAQEAYSLMRTFESIPQEINYAYDDQAQVAPSFWELSDDHIEHDIQIVVRDGQRRVTIAREAFTYAEPLLAEIEGVRGRFFSKRLHHAVVRFVTDNGSNRQALERILQDRYAISLNVPDYSELTRNTTQESEGRFTQFKNEELIAIASMLEEFPSGMRHTAGLNYLVRRLDGTPHPLYLAAPAVAWTTEGYIEFMESAFKESGPASMHRLILHEKAHFLWEHLFDEQLKQDWIELGGWHKSDGNIADQGQEEDTPCQEVLSTGSLFDVLEQGCLPSAGGPASFASSRDQEGWSTTKQTEFVSAYAHAKNPDEDMAESISYYIVTPDKLRSRAPAKYEFIQNRIMHGTRYISRIREDLTFEVYNLYPDVVYPGRIVRVDIQVEGEPEEDKEITIEIELHQEGDLDLVDASQLRIFSDKGTFFDLWLNPVDTNGRRIETGYILHGRITLSKYVADGYWRPDQITLTDRHGNERHESQADFGWKLYIDNPLADTDPPVYVKNSMRLSLSDATEAGRPYQILTAQWKLFEANGINGVLAQLNDGDAETASRRSENWGDYDHATGIASVDMVVPDYFPSGVWKLNLIAMVDIALNSRGVYFTHPGHGLREDQRVIDEEPASITIQTTNPDTQRPTLDLNNITIEAEPTNKETPNGETRVYITFKVKDNISGYRSTDMYLRDPQGVEHFFRHYRHDFYKVYFQGDPTIYKTYDYTITLPVGSVPGTWGLAEMTVWDKAQNKTLADFTEIVRFEVEQTSAKPLAAGPTTLQLEQNTPNPFNAETVLSYFLPKAGPTRLELFAMNGQRVALLGQGPQQAGHHRLHWNGRDDQGRPVASGIYLYRLQTTQGILTRKLTLLR